ncbi:S10 family peptidase [Undibacterium sp. TJN25]|uniref:S10 family peptidase n=1 Tax=Undibacterium sp. TJN25 TaxID=3413056 RepID=UPI003BEF715C
MHKATQNILTGLLGALLLALAACGGGGSAPSVPVTPPTAPDNGGSSDVAFADPVHYSSAGNASLAAAGEQAAVTHAQLTVNGKQISYTATTGHLTASDAVSGQPKASFFYVAYTADGSTQDKAARPVTFFYNGGPGSSTVWLHLGSYGPKRIVTNMPANVLPDPAPLVDNAESLLDTSDLVFVDAIGSGYSQAIAPNTNQTFWGVDQDAAAFRDFVARYVKVNQRDSSPKFLFGESYGGPRTAVLANLLESAGIKVAGVVLQSPILNYNSNCSMFIIGTVSCEGYIPSYAAIGANYLLTNPVPADLPAYAQQMRAFSAAIYRPAVAAYIANKTPPGAELVTQLVNFTGMADYVWRSNLDTDPGTFQVGLVFGQLIGRYDARVFASKDSPLSSEGDPSSTLITPAFTNNLADYMTRQLKYSANSAYTISSNAITTWDFSHDNQKLPDTVPDLAAAMLQNPSMKVLAISGYHDLATPFYQTEMDLARLGNNANIQVTVHPGGHMNYLTDDSRKLAKAELAAFYARAVAANPAAGLN